MKKIAKYIVACILVVTGVGLIFFGVSYKNKYHRGRMEIRSQISLGEYVLAEQKMSGLKNTHLYKLFARFKTEEYYQVSYDDGLIQLGLKEYLKAEKSFSTASESSNTEISAPAGINRIASLWFSGQRSPKIIKTILDIAGKVIKGSHNTPTSYEKREAQKIAYYIMARQQDMVQKKEGGDGDGPRSDGGGDKKNAQVEAFRDLMQKKAEKEGR